MKRAAVTTIYRPSLKDQIIVLASLALFIIQSRPARAQISAPGPQESVSQAGSLHDRPCRTFPNNCPPSAPQIEPEAGTWKPWLLESGSQLRGLIPAPPTDDLR